MTQPTMIAKRLVLAGGWALLATLTSAADGLRLPRIFSDRLVLQRDLPVPVWGWAAPGVPVTVEFGGQTVAAPADAEGRWRVTLAPMPASAVGRELKIAAGAAPATKTIADVLVGEVWFTAGQSNMMMGLGGATGGAEFHARRQGQTGGLIRVVNGMGPHLQAEAPQEDVAATWGEPGIGYSAVSYWFAHKLFEHFGGEVPVGMITYTAIVRAEAWVDEGTLRADPRLATVFDDALKHAAKTYNGVIAAIAPYAIRGVLYYQAEYNGFGDKAIQFRTLFPALIGGWRRAWQRPELPFLFVQLPGFITAEAPASDIDMDPATLAKYRGISERGTWTEVRDAQLHAWRTVPHTGMAVAIDVGEPYDIHPPNKEPVAHRLFLQARHVAYGEQLVHSGPMPLAVEVREEAMVATFDQVGSGLAASGGELKGFELAGADARFHPAQAAIDGASVVVRSPQVPAPLHLRYAWDGFPEATLSNREGLPATPFRWSDPARSPQPASGAFDWPNGSFEELNAAGQPLAWRLGPGAVASEAMAADGQRAVLLTEANQSGLFITGIVGGAGAFWNGEPLTAAAVRPGCLVSYSLELAVDPAGSEQKLYANLCQDASGSAYQAWGGTRDCTTASGTFVTRTVVQRLTDTITPAHFAHPDAAGARFIFQGGKQPGRMYVDNLTPVRILRPLLEVAMPATIDLGPLAPGVPAVSNELRIGNGQRQTFRQVLRDDDPGAESATVLYGAASFKSDGMGLLQKVAARTDHVGVVLIGPDAERFEFVSEQVGATRRELKLVGGDGQGGLTGGPEPESERFAIRFLGADQPGTYRATLRIVTQAGNLGTRSRGEAGEPPVNFYYLDRPVSAEVRGE